MSHVYASHVSDTHPLRRSAGIIFVVALHIAAIVAINSGLKITDLVTPIVTAHITPTFERPPIQPIPVEPVKPNMSTRFTINIPVPNDPPVESPSETPTKATMSQVPVNNGEQRRAEGDEVIFARVDPSHPLTQPAYPAASRRGNEQGRVELMLYILADGKVGEVRVAKSSGHARLDESAIREAQRSWRFLPKQQNGIAVPSWQRFLITFRLDN